MAATENMQREEDIAYYHWGRDGFSENTEISDNWEVRVHEDCRVFFVDHASRKTTWEHPTLKKKYKVPPNLPYGWQRYKDQEGRLIFVDHLTETCSYIDPRILLPTKAVFSSKHFLRSFVLLKHRFHPRTKASDVAHTLDHLDGKVVLVTGGSSGIGFETAKALVSCGCHVIIGCRNAIKAEAAVQRILSAQSNGKIESMHLDLGSLCDIEQCARDFKARHLPLHYFILNAAVFGLPHGTTVDGVEQHFGVNHLGHFYLFKLLENIICQHQTRMLVVSSESHWYPDTDTQCLNLATLANPPQESYSPILAYGTSKLCNILFALEVDRRYSHRGVTCNAIHPGNMLSTNITANAGLWYKLMYTLAWPFSRTVVRGSTSPSLYKAVQYMNPLVWKVGNLMSESVSDLRFSFEHTFILDAYRESQAAASVVFVSCHPSASTISGVYFDGYTPSLPSPEARYPGVAADLWRLSDELIREKRGECIGQE